MFVRALRQASGKIYILHFVPSDSPALGVSLQSLSEQQSFHWGTTVSVLLVVIAPTAKTFRTHYLNGLWSSFRQPDFEPFCSPTQVEAVKQIISNLPQGLDTIFVQGLAGMASLLLGQERLSRVFFDLNDIEHKARLRSALQPPLRPGKLIYAAQALKLIGMEAKAIRWSRSTFVCSDKDRQHLRLIGLGKSVHVVPNGVRMPAEKAVAAQKPLALQSMLFIGDYRYLPNQLAAERMTQRIWPIIHRKCPRSTLVIAGQGSERLVDFSHSPAGVTFPGFVSSLDGLYAKTQVVCCPMMVGGGTRLKLIEAAGYGKAIVSTRVGAEGLSLRNGTEILLCDDDIDFANACVALLEDEMLCQRLGKAASARVRAFYDVEVIEDQIARLMA